MEDGDLEEEDAEDEEPSKVGWTGLGSLKWEGPAVFRTGIGISESQGEGQSKGQS